MFARLTLLATVVAGVALLSHSAGLTVHGFPGYQADAPLPTLVQILDGVKPANTDPIRVNVLPGSLWRYSGGGYTVLQQLMIDATQKPFPAIMAGMVLEPIGMTDSTYEQPLPSRLRGVATSGHLASGQVVAGKYHTYPELAAAGLWTTPGDLARFAMEVQRAVKGESKLLTPSMTREMLKVQKGSYGLGLSLSGSGPDARFLHGGSNEGFQCGLAAFVEKGQGTSVMTNGDRGGRLAQEILRAIAREYGWPGYEPREKAIAQVDPRVFGALEGRYEIGPGHVVTASRIANRLFLLDRDQRVELFPESETRFFELVEENTVEFVKGPDGSVSHMLIDGDLKARRLPRS
jgi:CubicO group peptidase (beta-lactamase class C family)